MKIRPISYILRILVVVLDIGHAIPKLGGGRHCHPEISGADTAPFTHDVALAAYDLLGEFHRDPADHVLAATAMVSDLTLVSADERILTYEHLLSLDVRA